MATTRTIRWLAGGGFVDKEVTATTVAQLRSELDIRNEQISYKVREHSLQKVPYIIAVGKKEVENKSVSVRRLGSEKTESILLNDFVKAVMKEAKTPLEN